MKDVGYVRGDATPNHRDPLRIGATSLRERYFSAPERLVERGLAPLATRHYLKHLTEFVL